MPERFDDTADIEDLETFAGIRVEDIRVFEANDVRFRLLSLEQYLAVYQKSSKTDPV